MLELQQQRDHLERFPQAHVIGQDPAQPAPAAYGTGCYDPAATERTYAELLRRAGRLLALGEPVILDASWSSARHRDAALALLV